MQKLLIIVGIGILLVGLMWSVLSRLPFGRLPGDIVIEKSGLAIYIPITSMLIISAVVSLISWLVYRFSP